MVDAVEGVLGIEWIDGASVRVLLGGGAEGEVEVEEPKPKMAKDKKANEGVEVTKPSEARTVHRSARLRTKASSRYA